MKDGPESQRYDNVLSHLPLIGMQELLGRHAQFYTDWIRHPDYDDYWKKLNVEEVFEDIAIPVHTHGGWFDIFAQGTQNGYIGVSHRGKTEIARKKSHLVIGPWEHGVSRKTGDMDFGPDARVEREVFELPWFDYWLKGVDNGVGSAPPVTLFVMGKNVWRQENEFPLARTQYRKMYLSSGGHANTSAGDGRLSWDAPAETSSPDRYSYDPARPVLSTGGNNCCGTPTRSGPVKVALRYGFRRGADRARPSDLPCDAPALPLIQLAGSHLFATEPLLDQTSFRKMARSRLARTASWKVHGGKGQFSAARGFRLLSLY
jgi:putative CocE/NonD family hydrolase